MAAIPITSSELSNATAAATDMDTMLKDGATLNGTQVIPPTTGFTAGNPAVAAYFQGATIIANRHGGSGGAFLSAWSSVGQGIPSWSGTGQPAQQTINFDRVVKDTTSGMVADNNNWIWVPGVAGLYHIETQLSISGQAGDVGDTGFAICQLGLYKVATGNAETFDTWIGQGTHPMIDNNFIHGAGFIEIPDATTGIRLKMRQFLSHSQFITTIGGAGLVSNWIRVFRVGGVP